MRSITREVTETICDSWEEFTRAIQATYKQRMQEAREANIHLSWIDATNPHIIAFGVAFVVMPQTDVYDPDKLIPVDVFYILVQDVPSYLRPQLNHIETRLKVWESLFGESEER